jgi:hypothetical protein
MSLVDTPSSSAQAIRLVFSSDIQATVVLDSSVGDISLPSVTVSEASFPALSKISRVIAAISWRKQVDSSGAVNAIDAAQNIQVRIDTPGTYTNAISIADNSLSTGASATEGGMLIIGNIDIKSEVAGAGTYEFQWDNADVDGDSLTFHDAQTHLIVELK